MVDKKTYCPVVNYSAPTEVKHKFLNKISDKIIWTDITQWSTTDTSENFELIVPADVELYQNTDFTIVVDVSELQDVPKVVDLLAALGINNYLVLHTNYNFTHDRAMFFPVDFVLRSMDWDNLDFSKQRRYKLSCINRRLTSMRIYTFVQLSKKHYFNDCFATITLHDSENLDMLVDLNDRRFDDLPENVKSEFLNSRLYSKEFIHNDVSNKHMAFLDSCANICTESDPYIVYFTEKTAKPFASGQFLFSVNGQCSMQALREMGFDLFDDLFDHSYYDCEPDVICRINKMFELIDKHQRKMYYLHENHYERLMKNKNFFFSEKFRNNWFDKLTRKINDR